MFVCILYGKVNKDLELFGLIVVCKESKYFKLCVSSDELYLMIKVNMSPRSSKTLVHL